MKNGLKLTAGICLLCLALLPLSSAVSSEIYKWKDRDGKIHYSDTPPPPGMEAEIKRFKEEPAVKEKPRPSVGPLQPKSEANTQKGEKRSYSSINVTMYMTSW